MKGWKRECPYHRDHHYVQVRIWGQQKWRSSVAVGKILAFAVGVGGGVTFVLGLDFIDLGLGAFVLSFALVLFFLCLYLGDWGLFLDLTVNRAGVLTLP